MHILRTLFSRTLIFLVLLVPMYQARAMDAATLTAEIDALTVQGNTLLATTSTTTLTSLTAASQLAVLSDGYSAYLTDMLTVYNTLSSDTGSITVTDDLLQSMQALMATQAGLATASTVLTSQLVILANSTMTNSFYSMLRLSDDIGTMADRIGEMSGQIMIMADNIGVMADRILATQLIQNANIALTYDAILETQKNMIMLFSLYQ